MFRDIRPGRAYSRSQLAVLWGYKSYHALARGVVAPARAKKIILFVTEIKQAFQKPYKDSLSGNTLQWEGPTDHFAEERIISAAKSGEEIHLFYRKEHRSDFTYEGCLTLTTFVSRTGRPSSFVFEVDRG